MRLRGGAGGGGGGGGGRGGGRRGGGLGWGGGRRRRKEEEEEGNDDDEKEKANLKDLVSLDSLTDVLTLLELIPEEAKHRHLLLEILGVLLHENSVEMV